MKIVFHSNFMNHHQYALCCQFRSLGAELYFIEHEKLPEERKNLGYHYYGEDFIIAANEGNYDRITELTMMADAVIFGSKPERLYNERVNSGRLTFNFSERLFKKGRWRVCFPPLYMKLKKKYLFNKSMAPYVLCASAYAAQDYRILGYPSDHFIKWGYFPQTSVLKIEELLEKKLSKSIVWVGRFIGLKHPEYVVQLAAYLKKKELNFHIRMIGAGKLKDFISNLVNEMDVNDCIELIGALTPEEVLNEFEKAEIALVTSDKNEGWGAVVNEAMGSACAVVACEDIGSVNYLIKDGKNGAIYSSGNLQKFFEQVEKLLCNEELRRNIGNEAYMTIDNEWNYRVAAERLMDFIKERTMHSSGPVSEG